MSDAARRSIMPSRELISKAVPALDFDIAYVNFDISSAVYLLRLPQPCLPGSCPGVSATLTTMVFGHSSLWWLEISS